MRNINKIKELKDDRYTFYLDNKQIASIIISTISLGAVLFFTGYFIGKEGSNKENINDEIKTKNIAIINTTSTKTTKEPIHENKNNNNVEEIKDIDKKTDTSDNTEVIKDSEKKVVNNDTDNQTGKMIGDKEKNKENNNIINTPKLPENIKKNKGTGDKPFKTTLKSNEKGKYILQVLATPKLKEANELKNRLSESGYNAFIEQVDSNGVMYNRVRIGFFKNSEEAKLFKNNFEKESGIKKTFVTIKK